jgi:UDP-galactopyranose mutase
VHTALRAGVRLKNLTVRTAVDILCLSHLRWDFVFQRPQHLLTRFAAYHRVFFVEEPVEDARTCYLDVRRDPSGVFVVVPHIAARRAQSAIRRDLRSLIDGLIRSNNITSYVLWYYTPMALSFTGHLQPELVVYDCMDELSGFLGAPEGMAAAERRLMARADLVLTGGQSLYEAKCHLHHNIHSIPSSVDADFFNRARVRQVEPDDQAPIPFPRIGFFGVIDERLDIPLLRSCASARPDWHFVLVGPVVKIDPGTLPAGPNLHYLGAKVYELLPNYIAGWAVAILPFACNAATRFISPTKIPEYLAAGRPVVSTPIRDVVMPYGEAGLAAIAATPDAFVAAIAAALGTPAHTTRAAADRFLEGQSWDATWSQVSRLLHAALKSNRLRYGVAKSSTSRRRWRSFPVPSAVPEGSDV